MSHWSKKTWGKTNLYVKNFGKDITEMKLSELFVPYGTITSCKIPTDNNGASKGFGFVNFERPEMAQKAIDHLNGFVLENGQRLYVGLFQQKSERHTELRQIHEDNLEKRSNKLSLYLSNLDQTIDEHQLKSIFSKFGRITSTHIMRNGSQSKGVGFVCFDSTEDASRALDEMNGQWVVSKPIYVKFSQRNEDSQPMTARSSTPSSPAVSVIPSPTTSMSPVHYPNVIYTPTVIIPQPLNGYRAPVSPTSQTIQPTTRYSSSPQPMVAPSSTRSSTSSVKRRPYPYVLVTSDDQYED